LVLSTFGDVLLAAMVIMVIWVPLILLWCFALVDLFTRRDIRMRKIIWLLVIVWIPLLGPIIYLLTRPEDKIEAAEQQGMSQPG
jgi:hypothetical protein